MLRNITALRNRQIGQQSPGQHIGDALLANSSCPQYIVSQLKAYLAAAEADLEAENQSIRVLTESLDRTFREI